MSRSRLLHLVAFGSALAHGGCGAGGGTLTGAGGNTGMGTGSGGLGNVPGMNCGEVPGTARLLAPDIIIALDASSSMNDDVTNMPCFGGCGQSSKWAAAVAAINSVTASTADRVDWGLVLFGTAGVAACGAYTRIKVDPGPGTVGWIGMALRDQTAESGGVFDVGPRQTRGAINLAQAYFGSPGAPGSKFIVVLTDGAPMCIPDGGPLGDDTHGTVDAIAAAAAAGVRTFVVGIGTAGGPADASITAMGHAGRDEPDAGPGYAAWTANDISAALRSVADRTAGCTFEVPEGSADGTLNRSNIGVKVNGAEIVRDATHTNGWDYVDVTMSSVRLHGGACTAAKAAGPGAVTIHFRCLLI